MARVAHLPAWRQGQAVLVACLLMLCVVAEHAQAGLFSDDEARKAILEMREQRAKDQEALASLTEQTGRLSKSLIETNNQLEALRVEFSRLRGQNELIAKELSDMQQLQKDLQAGLDARVRQLEPKEISLDGKTFKAAPEEVAAYDKAFAMLREADFVGSLGQFQVLLNKYPNTAYMEAALYWQGNAHYGLGACKPAMESFRKLLAMNPKHQRSPEAMLSIANCHTELKEISQGRQLLQTLLKTYPDSEAAQVANERLAAATSTTAPSAGSSVQKPAAATNKTP